MTEKKSEAKHYGMELGPGQYVVQMGKPAPPTLPELTKMPLAPWYFVNTESVKSNGG